MALMGSAGGHVPYILDIIHFFSFVKKQKLYVQYYTL